jgi:hypothetical protein
MTIFITYKNRTSGCYKFSTTSLECNELKELKAEIKERNKARAKHNARNRLRVTIKARGPRGNNYYNTPRENATHFDIYVHEYYYVTYAERKLQEKEYAKFIKVVELYGYGSAPALAARDEYFKAIRS